MKKIILTSVICGLLAACGLETHVSGDVPPQTRLNLIKKGDDKEKVLRVLGTPASESVPLSDGQSFILYAQNMTQTQAFLDPKETKRDVYVFYFNDKNVLTKQEHLTLKDGQKIAYDPTITAIGGKELSVIDQIVQNFGRYNSGGQDSSVRR